VHLLTLRRGFAAALFVCALLIPAAASAQSSISGLVKDASGGVLPGVTVEASSPALIERARAVVTDDQGRYAIVDLRPGLYKVTFTLQGFTTFVRDGIDLPANFTATVNADLRIGAIEESVTVTGESPLVDVSNAQRTAVLKRDLIDAIPTGRTYAQLGLLAVGVRPSAQAVGGARTATQQRLLAHGQAPKDNTVAIDGMKMNSMYLGGETQANHNDAMVQEATVQTTSLGAEVSAGGVVVNLIPREGGNTFSGSIYAGYTGSSFQGDNLTPELQARGLRQGDAVDYVYDVNWFVVRGRADHARQAVVLRVASGHRQRQRHCEQLLSRRQSRTVRSAALPVHRETDLPAHAAEQDLGVFRQADQERSARLCVGD
jgi:hypothetical protein